MSILRSLPLFSGLFLLQLYKFLRFTLLCDCTYLNRNLVVTFQHPWYSGYDTGLGLADPYGVFWWMFHSLFAANLFLSIGALTIFDACVLWLVHGRVSTEAYLLLVAVDFLVFYTAPVDMLVFWLLTLGIVYGPLFSIAGLLTKLPLWPAPAYYLKYILHGPVSHLTLEGSWRYGLFLIMFVLGWILAWIQDS